MGYPMEAVFVFGSNRAGRHGAGAALHAAKHWGAEAGVGEGRTGNAYALPTKDEQLRTLPIGEIREGLARFFDYARGERELFLLTPIGTGLAGIPLGVISALLGEFAPLPGNVALTGTWIPARRRRGKGDGGAEDAAD